MSTATILVIDDSATIRKMVDSHLSQEGYRVVMAPTGEQGIELASEIQPDLILLDHQLPGTTGIAVCRQIIERPECSHIPFVVSSTLRKQAYVEYMDVPNVVDSLPKPFKPDLLKMTVSNALETGAMIVASQASGTAVPEVVDQTDQPALSGDFQWLGLREVIDFLNNGQKTGMLEVELERNRVCFFLQGGRIQGVVSPSFDVNEIAEQLPENMRDLSPLLQFTMSSGTSTRVDGLVELMDKKVLDPRMLRSLLRHQAAVLTRYCFLNNPGSFNFFADRMPPSLFAKAAIDTCLAAVLIDGAMNSPSADAGTTDSTGWVRNGLRGQNLDRTGISARHGQLLSLLDSTPRNAGELAARSGLTAAEATGVLEGLLLAEWVEMKTLTPTRTLVAFEPDPEMAGMLRSIIDDSESNWSGNVVRDDFSLQLLLKRKSPDAVIVAVDGTDELRLPEAVRNSPHFEQVRKIVLLAPPETTASVSEELSHYPLLQRPCTREQILEAIEHGIVVSTVSVGQGTSVGLASVGGN